MGKYVLENALVKINGVDLSNRAQSLTITDSADQIEFTAFGGNGYKEFGQGLKDATAAIDFYSDFDANEVHATLQPLYASGGTFMFETRPDSTTGVSATNPRGSMICRLYSYSGISGKVGDASMFTAELHNAGNGITWGTAP